VEMEGLQFKPSPGKKVSETPISTISGGTCLFSQLQGKQK
jgi:hypothetical protein